MAELLNQIHSWMYLIFTVLMTTGGLFLLFSFVVYLFILAVEKVLGAAALIEAANELRRQGKAKWLGRWLRFGRWRRDE